MSTLVSLIIGLVTGGTAIAVALINSRQVREQAEQTADAARDQAQKASDAALKLQEKQEETATRLSQFEHMHRELERVQTETGPLRLYMYLCARAAVRWLKTYSDDYPWPVKALPQHQGTPGYHTAGPMIYRLLRPLTVGGLIVHRMHDADLALDLPMVEIVRFHNAAYEIFTRQEIVELARHDPSNEMPKPPVEAAWSATVKHADPENVPFQRIRDSYLRWAADALIKEQVGKDKTCMSHSDFLERWEEPKNYRDFHYKLSPVTTVIDGFDPYKNPFFWLRLVAYVYVCTWYMHKVAAPAKAQEEKVIYTDPVRSIDIEDLLTVANRPKLFDYKQKGLFTWAFEDIINNAL